MNKLKIQYMKCLKISFSILIFLFIAKYSYSNEIKLEIKGNNFTDKDVILSLIKNKPTDLSQDYSNYLIKTLNNSQLFENVSVKIENNNYIISINEYPNIRKVYLPSIIVNLFDTNSFTVQ